MAERPLISAIAAVSSNNMLGLDGWLPWDIPEELAYFERMIKGAALVIGRLTYESMDVVPEEAFIVSRQPDLPLRPGCHRMPDVETALRAALRTGKPVFVIGGASIYEAAWQYCDFFYLTRINKAFVGDTAFPTSIDLDSWRLMREIEACYQERLSGEDVVCRFLQYAQNVPGPHLLLSGEG